VRVGEEIGERSMTDWTKHAATRPVALLLPRALVQIARGAEIFLIIKDTSIRKQDRIPDIQCSGILEPESPDVKLTLANAMHQLDA